MLAGAFGFYMNRCVCHQIVFSVLKRTTSTSVAKPASAEKVEVKPESLSSPVSKARDVSDRKGTKANLIATAFASLKKKTLPNGPVNSVDLAIKDAKTPESLLKLVDTSLLSRKQALKMLSILAEWSITGSKDVKLNDFEKDPRFSSLCEILGQSQLDKQSKPVPSHSDDLSVVINVKNDDDATKMIHSLNVSQLIKVLSSLALKKRRSIHLLRSLSFRLCENTNKLNIKQGADILYALASLSFPDEVLIERVVSDICELIVSCQKTSVIGSIATSLGHLRYKDTDLLNALCDWFLENKEICRTQDSSSILYTCAIVNHQPPTEFLVEVRKAVSQFEMPLMWLDAAWSLAVLDQATPADLEPVLSSAFISKLSSAYPDGIPVPAKLKLLNINGVAKVTKGYNGPLLDTSSADLTDIPLSRSKEKLSLAKSVFDAMSNLLPSAAYLRTNVNIGMGFVIDGECMVDSKMTPLLVLDRKTGEPLPKSSKGIKVAVMVWDYHDITRGQNGPSGLSVLSARLAASSGYKVLPVLYSDFSSLEKLTTRVQYLETSLKKLVLQS